MTKINVALNVVYSKSENVNGRNCNGCVRCCDGSVSANIHGFEMGRNSPCFLLDQENKRCGDYMGRPGLCRTFRCHYLTNPDMPEEVNPRDMNALVAIYEIEGHEYMMLCHTKDAPSPELVEWATNYCNEKDLNLCWWADGKLYQRGSAGFKRALRYAYDIQ